MTYYLNDGGHVLISGATGSRDDYGGKSVLANWWFSELVERGHRDFGVFVNPKAHSFVRGASVGSLQGLADSYRSGRRLFNYRSEAVDRLVEWVDAMPGEAVVVFDEAWLYKDSEGLKDVVRMFGNKEESTRALVVTQSAWDLPEELLNNLPLKVWVGPVTSEGKRYFQTIQVPDVTEKLDGAMRPYHWAVIDGGELQHINKPVPEEYSQ